MKNPRFEKFAFMAFLLLAGVAALVWVIAYHSAPRGPDSQVHLAAPYPTLLLVLRWAAWLAFIAYAFARRSLTPWIFAGMLIGAEIGNDWPHLAVSLQVL